MASKLEIILSAKNETAGPINQVKQALSGLGGLAKTTMVAAGAATVGAVAGITAAIGVGVGKAADLEQGLADIASVMGITFDEAKPLGDLIQSLGIDPKLKVDAVGASDAIMQLAQSGISMTDILDGAARSTVLLSNATGGDMATSAAVASDAMALFGISAKDMQVAVNGITGVTVASKFGINDYALALSQGGGVAAVAGVSFADFNTTIAAISPYFASGSDAGTSFKTFLQRLVPASNAAEGAMMQLGLITADGKNAFFDASGQMKSMAEIAGILQTATAGLSEEQKTATLSTIFGADAIRAASAIAEAGSGKFNELAGSLAKVDAEQSAATRMNTFASQMEILQGIIDGLLTQIGQAFLPILRELANWATEYVDQNGAALVGWFEQLAQWIKDITPLVLEWGRVLIGALGELSNWLQGQHTSFGYLNQLWSLLQWAVTAAVGNIVQFIQDHLPDWLNTLAQWGLAAWQWIVDAMPVAAGKVGELFNGAIAWVRDSLPGWLAGLAGWAAATWQWVVDATPTVMAKLGELWAQIKRWLDDNAGGIGTKLETWGGKFSGFLSIVQTGWSKAWPDIQKIVNEAATSIVTDFERIKTSLGEIGAWFSGSAPGADTDSMINRWATFWTTVVDIIAGAEKYMIDSAANVIDAIALVGNAIRTLATGDWSNLDSLGGQLRDLEMSIAQGNIDRMNWMAGMFSRFFSGGARADGGPVSAGGRYMVGERGPELFVPSQDGTIAPNGAGVTTNNYYTIQLSGTADAGRDVMSTVQTLQALYG